MVVCGAIICGCLWRSLYDVKTIIAGLLVPLDLRWSHGNQDFLGSHDSHDSQETAKSGYLTRVRVPIFRNRSLELSSFGGFGPGSNHRHLTVL